MAARFLVLVSHTIVNSLLVVAVIFVCPYLLDVCKFIVAIIATPLSVMWHTSVWGQIFEIWEVD